MYITVQEFYGWKEFHPLDKYVGHVRQRKKKQKKTSECLKDTTVQSNTML